MAHYRFDVAVSVRVSVPDEALLEPGELVGPFIDWFDARVQCLLDTISDKRLVADLTAEATWREGIGELFRGDETGEALLAF